LAVSKRLRFEILRRDNHTCYYCGRKPPEIEITIDHVLPRALGGEDIATNLVAACADCNGGKTSIAPGSPLVAQVDADAARWSAAMQAAINKANADHEAVAAYRNEFHNAWQSYSRPAPMDENWRQSVENFRARGLPIGLLTDAVHRAMAMSQVQPGMKFKYMCKVAWNRVRELEREARTVLGASALAGAAPVDKDAVILDALVAVWRATWLEFYGTEPGAALLAEARQEASELLEYDYFIHDLVAGAEEAAARGTADIETHIPLSLEEGTLLHYMWGWAHSDGAEAPLDDDTRNDLAGQLGIAQLSGYSDDSIYEAVFRAADEYSPDFLSRLGTIDKTLDHLKSDSYGPQELRGMIRGHQVDTERLDYLRQRVRDLYEEAQKSRAERAARGDDMPNWGA
jgi:hypothetical protein